MRTPISTVAILVGFAVACASAGRSAPDTRSAERAAAGSRCAGQLDSLFVKNGPVYRACEVDDSARLASQPPRPRNYRYSASDRCLRADVDIVVRPDGTPDPDIAKVVRTNSSRFAQAVLDEVPTLRYRPAIKNGQPVAQVTRISVMVASVLVRREAGSPPTPPPQTMVPRC